MSDIDPNSLSIAQDLTGAQRVGSDEFFYDIFGVNIKGLKSIWTLIQNPVEYFEAARLPDWGGDHWPSIRIWLGLMGLLVALQFLWASENSEMTAMFQMLAMVLADSAASTEGVAIDISELDRQALGKQAFKRWIFIYPFFFIAAMCVLAFIFRPWKPFVGFVIRLRYIFAIIIPASIFGIFSTFAMVNLSGELYQLASFVSIPIMMCIYAVTAFRGPFHDLAMGERVGMSIIVAILIMFFLFIAQFISMILAVTPTWMEVMETLRPQIEAARDAKNATTP
ncbi:MAG: hypothetical protein ABJO36_01065 [Litorimonas sp.]